MVETKLRSELPQQTAAIQAASSSGVVSGRSLPSLKTVRRAVRLTKASVDSEEGLLVQGCVKAMFALLSLFGYRERDGDLSFDRTVRFWREASVALGDGGWMKFAKWKFADYFYTVSYSQLDAPPPVPDGLPERFVRHTVFASGRAGRYARKLSHGPHRLHFAASVLQLKKACPRPTPSMLEKAKMSTLKSLTTARRYAQEVELPPTPSSPVKGDEKRSGDSVIHVVTVQDVKDQLIRTVRELFAGKSYATKDKLQPMFPSTRASFDDPRSVGGAVRSIRSLAKRLGLGDCGGGSDVTVEVQRGAVRSIVPVPGPMMPERRLWSALQRERLTEWKGVPSFDWFTSGPSTSDAAIAFETERGRPSARRQEVIERVRSELTGRDPSENEGNLKVAAADVRRPRGTSGWQKLSRPSPRYVVDVRKLEERAAHLYDAAFRVASESQNEATAVALAEALKVRIITKGDPYVGYVLRPLQRFLLRVLRKHPAFELIGAGNVTDWYIQRRMGAVLRPGEAYLSGDYSAATDNLAPWVSETIARAIASTCDLSPQEEDLFVKALVEHWFDDPTTRTIRSQEWGQLMGSVVSFPVLCIANAAICRMVIEADRGCPGRLSLRNIPLMINGDDCALRCTDVGLKVWKSLATFVGLEPSIGKFFFSREFVQINSENFERLETPVSKRDPDSGVSRLLSFRTTEFFNLGLWFGQKRSGGRTEGVLAQPEESVGTRVREFLRRAPEGLRDEAYRLYIATARDEWEKVGVPWFLPEGWGGLGLPPLYAVDSDLEGKDEYQTLYGKRAGQRRAGRESGKDLVLGPSKLDMRVAALIAARPDKFPVGRIPSTSPWNVNRIVKQRLSGLIPTTYTTEAQQRSYDSVYAALSVDALFHEEDIYEEPDDLKKVANRNQRSWRSAVEKLGKTGADGLRVMYEPLDVRSVWMQPSPPLHLPDMTVISNYGQA